MGSGIAAVESGQDLINHAPLVVVLGGLGDDEAARVLHGLGGQALDPVVHRLVTRFSPWAAGDSRTSAMRPSGPNSFSSWVPFSL